MEEKIIELLKNENKALDFYTIKDALELETADEFKQLTEVLNNLEKRLKIIRTKKDKYMTYQNNNLKVGTMMANRKGFGFVDIEGDEDVYIRKENMNGAIQGDKVVVEITSEKNNIKLEGRIVRIVDRSLDNVVGELYFKDDQAYINLDDDKLKITVQIDSNKTMGAMPGHKVLVRVAKQLKNNHYTGEVLKVLGHKNDPGVDVLSIAYKYDIESEFPEEVMKQVEAIPDHVLPEELKARELHDLREKVIFTIDGDDTKDIDDAISIERVEQGYKLGVHIADVSYYVKEGTPLDLEAQNRGTSVYLADRVIPMLPHKLSNGICSLNPGVDRLAISCEMIIDKNGKVVDYDIFESIIRSCKQMTYNNVNKILEQDIIPEGYEEYAEDIRMMADLAKNLRKAKISRGYINFDIDESKIIVDDKGKAIDVVLRNRGIGENLIEDFMIVANETVASHVFYMNLPFIYRIHGEPNEEKIQNFLNFVSILGHKINGKIKDLSPKTVQKILDELKDMKEFHILSKLLLRSMQKAVYDTNNIGHFGLASKIYTHFTSPIRRYPDTTVHRLLRAYQMENRMDPETINFYETNLPFLAKHCSDKERSAIDCEREVDDMKKAEYMMDHIGEEYEGIISGVMSFGMFVELPNLVEGLVRLDDLTDDYYTFDETSLSLIGKKNKRGYRLGDNVVVIVKGASKITRTVDFELPKTKTLTK